MYSGLVHSPRMLRAISLEEKPNVQIIGNSRQDNREIKQPQGLVRNPNISFPQYRNAPILPESVRCLLCYIYNSNALCFIASWHLGCSRALSHWVKTIWFIQMISFQIKYLFWQRFQLHEISLEISQQAQAKPDLFITWSEPPRMNITAYIFHNTALQSSRFGFEENESSSDVCEEQHKTKTILK